ncbi:glycosyltransferase [bacterium]|nr:glycosyltransferase [bacterium]
MAIKVSIITPSYNSENTIEDTIQSILCQKYKYIEHIIIDGGSTDGTLDIIKEYRDRVAYWISEPDDGIYDAMNKGIKAATGEIVGILNSDDIYADNSVIEEVVNIISIGNTDTCYGDLMYVDKDNTKKVIRQWKSGNFSKEKFKLGWAPPHPTFFVRRSIYEKYGYFKNSNFPIAADYELMLRFLYKIGCSTEYIPKVLVKMRTGGRSRPSLTNTINSNIECYRAWKINDLNPNPITFILKPLSKVNQYIKPLKSND